MRMKVKGEKKDGQFFPHSQVYCNAGEFLKAWTISSHLIGMIMRGKKKALSTLQVTIVLSGTVVAVTVIRMIIVVSILIHTETCRVMWDPPRYKSPSTTPSPFGLYTKKKKKKRHQRSRPVPSSKEQSQVVTNYGSEGIQTQRKSSQTTKVILA